MDTVVLQQIHTSQDCATLSRVLESFICRRWLLGWSGREVWGVVQFTSDVASTQHLTYK